MHSKCRSKELKMENHLEGLCVREELNDGAPCVLYIGQVFRYSPENAFYLFNQQIYFII